MTKRTNVLNISLFRRISFYLDLISPPPFIITQAEFANPWIRTTMENIDRLTNVKKQSTSKLLNVVTGQIDPIIFGIANSFY